MKEWFLTYFDENYYKDYTDILTPEKTEKEVRFILKVLSLPKGLRILDLGCGQGRIAIPIAKAGYEVVGVDTSRYLLGKAKQEARQQRVKVKFILKDMRKIYFENKFDAVICMLTSFGYFNEKDNRKVIENVADSLVKGGKFLLDVGNPDWVISNMALRSKKVINDLMVEEKRSISSDRKYVKNRITYTYIKSGKKRTVHTKLRQYTLEELSTILSGYNMSVIRAFGDYKMTIPLTSQSKRLILLSERVL